MCDMYEMYVINLLYSPSNEVM